MFKDKELEELYSQLDLLCNPRPKNNSSVKEIANILTSNQVVSNSSSVKELQQLIQDLEDEENLGKMEKDDLFLGSDTELSVFKKNSAPILNVQTKFIGKQVAADGVFSNIKHNIRQSNKKRIEAYANTNAKVVKESNMEPLQLQQYTDK